MSAVDLLIGIGNGELPAWSSIVRVRRKIQEIDSELRGNLYQKRQESKKTYIKEIREIELMQLRKQLNKEG